MKSFDVQKDIKTIRTLFHLSQTQFKNFRTLHSLSIEEAIAEVFEIANIEEEDKYALFKKIYSIDH